MPTLTLEQKPTSKKVRVEIDLDQWERLADIFGFYQQKFLKTIKRSLNESRGNRVRKITSLRELDS